MMKRREAQGNVSKIIWVSLVFFFLALSSGPACGAPPVNWWNNAIWKSLGTDPSSGAVDEAGCPNHRDVLETFWAGDENYLYLRMVNVSPAGWPSTQPTGQARYKWFFDIDAGGARIVGTNAFHVEYLLLLEDRTNGSNVDGARDRLGELTLIQSNFNPVGAPLGSFTEVWNLGNSGLYISGPDPSVCPCNLANGGTMDCLCNRYREMGTGTAGTGGPQGAEGADIGYRMEGNVVDMYVSWAALGNPQDDVCLIWATDINNPNLDQTPNCDRVEENINACAIRVVPKGTITVVKDTEPQDAQDFGFTSTGGLSPASFTLDDDGDPTYQNSITFADIPPGTYTITEGSVSGWTLSAITFSDPNCGCTPDVASGTATVHLTAGDNITVTFVNVKDPGEGQGKIIVVKDAKPDDPQIFGFNITDNDEYSENFQLDDDGVGDNDWEKDLVSGVIYTITETVPAGWKLAGISVVGAISYSVDIDNRQAQIDLGEGEVVTVTLTNEKKGSIKIVKDAIPNDPETFYFTSADLGNFSIVDNGGANSQTFPDLESRIYSVAETLPLSAGWVLSSIISDDPNGNTTTDEEAGTATIHLDPGEDITVVFSNTYQAGTLTVRKISEPATEDLLFHFTNDIPNCVCNGQFDLSGIDAMSEVYFTGIIPGTYTITEVVPPGWELVSINGADSVNGTSATVNLGAYEDVVLVFTNRLKPPVIPTLSEWGTLIFLVAVGLAGLAALRRRRGQRGISF